MEQTKKNYFQNYSIDVDDNLKRKNFIYLWINKKMDK